LVVDTQNTLMAEIAKAGATPLASERSCSLKMNFKRSYTEHVRMVEPAVKTSEVPQREWQTPQTRRDFLTASTTGALALLLAGLPPSWVGGVYAGDGPETLFDGVEFDPAQPEQYVRMFAVHNLS
jgi:hypothetical protein